MALTTPGLTQPGIILEEIGKPPLLMLAVKLGEGEPFVAKSYEHEGRKYSPASVDESSEQFFLPEAIGPAMDVEELVAEIIAYVGRYITLPKEFAIVSARYTLLSWVYERFRELPYLRVWGPPGAGKSRYLDVMARVVRRGYMHLQPTTAVIFRCVDETRPTLILEEGESVSPQIREVMRGGFQRGRLIQRCEGEGVKHRRAFNPYGPKIVATYGRFADDPALESRCLSQRMRPGMRDNKVSVTLSDSIDAEGLDLRNKLLRWRLDNFASIKVGVSLIEGVSDRLNQVAQALLAVTGDKEHREAIIAYVRDAFRSAGEDTADTLSGHIAHSIVNLWEEKSEPLPGGLMGMPISVITADLPVEFADSREIGKAARTMGLRPARTKSKRYVLIDAQIIADLRAAYFAGR